jgi:hypothetical protein
MKTVAEFNKHRINRKFAIEKEHNSINLLDLTLHRERTKLNFTIYRKPTPKVSCHPREHKISSINCLIKENTILTIKEAREKEPTIVQNTLQNNKYTKELSAKHLNPALLLNI